MDRPTLISIIAILISLSAIVYGQEVDVTRGYTTYYWPAVEWDTIEQGERLNFVPGNGIEITYSPFQSTAQDLLNLYDLYYDQIDSVRVHELPSDYAYCLWRVSDEKCTDPDHYKTIKPRPSFEGFIKWLKQQ